MLYVISYDLRKPGRDYKSLTDALKGIGAQRVLESVWAARRDQTSAEKLRDYFKKFIDSNDRLLVVAVSDWATWNAMVDINKV